LELGARAVAEAKAKIKHDFLGELKWTNASTLVSKIGANMEE